MNRRNEPKDLQKQILSRIEREERRTLAWKAAGCAAGLVLSVALVFASYVELMTEASRSGLFSFLSLMVSDFSIVVANFSDFIFSILESFPVFSAALLLSGIFFGIWSAAQFLNEIVLIRKHRFN